MNPQKIKYGSYYRNDDFDDLSIEYELRLFKKLVTDYLKNNIVESLKVSSIKQSFDNRTYESNPLNPDLYDVPFDGYQMLIAG